MKSKRWFSQNNVSQVSTMFVFLLKAQILASNAITKYSFLLIYWFRSGKTKLGEGANYEQILVKHFIFKYAVLGTGW
jgi:hypothetical protein